MIDRMNELSDVDLLQNIMNAEASQKQAASELKRLKAELINRTEEKVSHLYSEKDEPYGDVSFEAFGQKIKFSRPKKVEWNQDMLKSIGEQIVADGGNLSDYIDIEYNVPESKWKAWGQNIRAYFMDARTVSAGNMAVKIEESK